MRFIIACSLLALAVTPTRTVAQAHDHDHASPYAAFADREIKALSAEELAGLANGDGLGMALPAELNGYPGPRHVLELAEMLALTDAQRTEVQAIFDEMQSAARSLGREIIALERELDRGFGERTITEDRLVALLDSIASRRGRLRAAHLEAHLRVSRMLSESQREHYDRARGYRG